MLRHFSPRFTPVEVRESDLLTINYTSGTSGKPKGVMITHRNAYLNVIGTLVHVQMSTADRYLWTLPMFHANGWTTQAREVLEDLLLDVPAGIRMAERPRQCDNPAPAATRLEQS